MTKSVKLKMETKMDESHKNQLSLISHT